MLRKEKGFTLIELLIVIAIIGILAAIAIPMYRTQTIKAKMTEVTNGMSNVASAVAAYWQEAAGGGAPAWPNCTNRAVIQSSLGVSLAALSRLQDMKVDSASGTITATVTNIDTSVNNQTLILIPATASDNSITWTWTGGAGMPSAYVPKR